MKSNKIIRRLEALIIDIENNPTKLEDSRFSKLYVKYTQNLLSRGLYLNCEVYKNRYQIVLLRDGGLK